MKPEKSTTLFVSEGGWIVRVKNDYPDRFIGADPDLKQPISGFAKFFCGMMIGAMTASLYWVIFIWLRLTELWQN